MDFIRECEKLGFSLTDVQLKQFEDYYLFLVNKNQVMNLTTITEKEDVYIKHFLDSIQLLKVDDFSNKTILDVGSGAGFPSIPMKIVLPSIKVTIIDALQKRIAFLEELTDILSLEGVTLIHGRAEEFKHRDSFDFVTSRAVAKLNILLELTLPFVSVGGKMIAMKSSRYEDELSESLEAMKKLGGSLHQVIHYQLSEELTHSLIIVGKLSKTNSIYPRNFGQIKKKPL